MSPILGQVIGLLIMILAGIAIFAIIVVPVARFLLWDGKTRRPRTTFDNLVDAWENASTEAEREAALGATVDWAESRYRAMHSGDDN